MTTGVISALFVLLVQLYSAVLELPICIQRCFTMHMPGLPSDLPIHSQLVLPHLQIPGVILLIIHIGVDQLYFNLGDFPPIPTPKPYNMMHQSPD